MNLSLQELNQACYYATSFSRNRRLKGIKRGAHTIVLHWSKDKLNNSCVFLDTERTTFGSSCKGSRLYLCIPNISKILNADTRSTSDKRQVLLRHLQSWKWVKNGRCNWEGGGIEVTIARGIMGRTCRQDMLTELQPPEETGPSGQQLMCHYASHLIQHEQDLRTTHATVFSMQSLSEKERRHSEIEKSVLRMFLSV